jgi:hypothetical protein
VCAAGLPLPPTPTIATRTGAVARRTPERRLQGRETALRSARQVERSQFFAHRGYLLRPVPRRGAPILREGGDNQRQSSVISSSAVKLLGGLCGATNRR